MRVRGSLVLLAAALSTVLVAVALASSSGTASVIHGCYAKRGGQLRVATSCSRGEIAVRWNKQGPAGVDGAPGAEGPIGPSAAWDASGPKGGAMTLTTTKQTVDTIALPAGHFVVWGSVTMLPGTAEHWVDCDIRESNGTFSPASAIGSVMVGTKLSLAMDGGGTLSSAGTVKLECAESDGAGNASVAPGAVLDVIKVGTITVS
jgi:hypothetical protein